MMSFSFDALRGIPGIRRFGVLLAITVILLGVNLWLSSQTGSLTSQNTAKHSRMNTLFMLGSEYKAQQGSTRRTPAASDVAAVFARVSERMQLGSRVNRITPDGANQSVEVNRLYAEELVQMYNQLTSQGVRVIAAELRALPAGQERLFTLSAIIGPGN